MTADLFAHIPPPAAPVDPDRLPLIHRLLLGYYGQPKPRTPWDPLTQFVYSLLSSRTKTPASEQVMRDLESRFGRDWTAVRDASVQEIEQTIQVVTFPELKAPRLKLALQQITARYGSLTLDFLAGYRTEKIRAWLESFEGVGPQVSAAVVNFSTLRRRALSLDGNHLRVVHRLGLTPRGDASRTEELLMRMVPETWNPEMLDEHHSLFKIHGQTLCTFADPQCPACPLLKLCRYGQRNLPALS
jgi:endonuclease-3